MLQLLSSAWFKQSLYLTVTAVALTFIPVAPVAVVGALLLITWLPGVQWVRWLGLSTPHWDFRTVVLSLAVGLVTSPILIYWGGLLFGFSREVLLVLLPLYIILLAAGVARQTDPTPSPPVPLTTGTRWTLALLSGFVALGVFLAYFELETPAGFYPVQMEDWQKHYGVAFALRYTGIPPTSPFFYGMFPHEQLVYYYFLHLNGATLDLLQGGEPFLHYSFVTIIVLASILFSGIFFVLAETVLRSQKAALWSLAFATIIGGLDIIPTLQRAIQKYRENFPDGSLPPDVLFPRDHIDNWISALSLRLNTFFGYHIWVPQHLTGLTILCLGCYLYLKMRDRRKLLVILPLLLFTLLGHSTWLALIVLICLFFFALYQILTTYHQQGPIAARTLFFAYALIALVFLLIAAPFMLSLVGPAAPKSGLAFEIPTLDSWPLLRPFETHFGKTSWARLLDLPLHYFIEMGALLVAGLAGLGLFWRQDDKTADKTAEVLKTSAVLETSAVSETSAVYPGRVLLPFWLLLLGVGLLTISFFASGRGWAELNLIQNNDLGLRALMPGQLVLALFAGYFMVRLFETSSARWWQATKIGGISLLIGLGLTYSLWEFTAMGLAKYRTEPQLSGDAYNTLRAMPDITAPQDKRFPVVQYRLHRELSRFQLSLGGQPVGFSTGEAIVFHRDVQDLARAHELSQQAFANGLPVWSYQMFQSLGANYIVVSPAEREAMRHPEKYQHRQYFRRVFAEGDFEVYQVLPRPYTPDSAQTFFDSGAIEFEGYFIDLNPLYPGDKAAEGTQGLVTAWRLTRPADKNYTVFIHLVDATGNIVGQADHQLWAWDVRNEGPTTTWTPGLTHLDIVPIPAELLNTAFPLTIRLGLWLPDTGQQFPAEEASVEVDPGGRLVVGELRR